MVDVHVTAFRLDGREYYVWWQNDDFAQDRVLARDGRVLWYQTGAECLTAGRALGLSVENESEPVVPMDFDPAVAWAQGGGDDQVPAESALNLWNFAGDVARGTGVDWSDRNETLDSCYDKLVAINIPWLMGTEDALPTCLRAELSALRQTLADAATLIRQAL